LHKKRHKAGEYVQLKRFHYLLKNETLLKILIL
jgi:hypothetical protein